jgi:hypothetical protein
MVPDGFAELPSDRRSRTLAPALAEALHALDARYAAALDRIPMTARDVVPTGGGWTAHQVLEHVTLANEQYLAALAPLAEAVVLGPAADTPWRPTFMGWLLARSLTQRVRQRAPAAIVPGPAPRPAVAGALRATHEALRALLARTAGRDWRRGRMRSPLASWVRLNVGDACLIMLRHGERHAGQLERLADRVR